THFESAETAAGLQLSVTGVLGFRTVHQVNTVNCIVGMFHS
ncbi:tetratricopeptide repeat protein 27-like, partial [Trifolium medium]|nr:tetratricopeptide repeat protein 27-like [Trifolium medium]